MNITVILCTYNRCRSLATALDSVATSTLPNRVEWEVLVVDNNSRDQTREVIEDCCRRYPGRFRYLFEPRQGKSYALNTGIREAKGDVLAFMDDDVTVESTWLRNLTANLHDNKWAGTGGRIILEWPASLPNWVSTDGPYARHGFPGFDQGAEAKDLIGPPFGTNMAFRKEMFEKHGGFRTDLGPVPGNEIRSEDTEFGRRLISAGEHLRYEPSAIVFHPVPENKINKKHFLRWQFDKGRGDAREFPVAPAHLVCSLAAWTVRWMIAVKPPVRFHAKLVVWEKVGTLKEWLQLSSETKKKEEPITKPRSTPAPLDLKAGDWVEVRTREEILATLDGHGRLENMPFMPEMLRYCGQKYRVSKRADKTCQYTVGWSIRRIKNAVHLESVRCDGDGHGGCQASCLIFWKEAWLKRSENNVVSATTLSLAGSVALGGTELCTIENILATSQTVNPDGETIYSCQETDVYKFSSYMNMWDPRQYSRDLRSGNLRTGLSSDSRAQRTLDSTLGVLRVLNALVIGLFNEVQTKRHRDAYPYIAGTLEKTPFETLELQPGELVQVRSKDEIVATLDKQNRNRGLLFDWEMVTYCGGIYRVLRKVHRIVDDKSGRMMIMKYPCVILEGVACRSDYHRLCPRAIYHYWRENWLKRAVDIPAPLSAEQIAETCDKS